MTEIEINENNKEIGERLRKIRIATKLTKEQMAEALQVSVETYNGFEEGTGDLCVSHICALYDISPLADPDYILTGKASADIYIDVAFQTMPDDMRCLFSEKLNKYLERDDVSDINKVLTWFSDLIKYGREHIKDKRIRECKQFFLFTYLLENRLAASASE